MLHHYSFWSLSLSFDCWATSPLSTCIKCFLVKIRARSLPGSSLSLALALRLTQSLCFYTHSTVSACFIIYQLKIMRALCCFWTLRVTWGESAWGSSVRVWVCLCVCIAMCHLFMLLSSTAAGKGTGCPAEPTADGQWKYWCKLETANWFLGRGFMLWPGS